MSGETFSGGPNPHQPEKWISDNLLEGIERNITYGCVDIALRNPQTGEFYLGERLAEPQLGPWQAGGRIDYESTISQSAKKHLERDIGLVIPEKRFEPVGFYKTDFPVANDKRDQHGRSTLNGVFCVDLTPEEVKSVDKHIAGQESLADHKAGGWYKPDRIASPDTDFPFAIKQFVRDQYANEVAKEALHELALKENVERDASEIEARSIEYVQQDLKRLGYPENQAELLAKTGKRNAIYAIGWVRYATLESGTEQTTKLLEAIHSQPELGDYRVKKMLRAEGVLPPDVSDNGPALRMITETARLALLLDINDHDSILEELRPAKPIGRPGPLPTEEL